MNTAVHYYHRGLGTSGSAIATTAVSAGGSVGSSIALAALIPTLGVPVAGAIAAGIMGVTIAIDALINSGCGQTCVVTSQWANQAEALLEQNLSQYFAVPTPRSKSLQQTAMTNFQNVWNALVQQCSQPGLGTAGQNCINDRKDGACKWKATAPSYPGEPAAGACWNWWNGYYYPIANDPNVVADSASTLVSSAAGTASSALSTASSALSSIFGTSINPILLLGAGLIGLAMLADS